VINTNDIISKIIPDGAHHGLSRLRRFSRFEGSEIHYAGFAIVPRYADILLDFPNGCVVGRPRPTARPHPESARERLIAPDEELLILAEDDNILFAPYPPVRAIRSPYRAPQPPKAGGASARARLNQRSSDHPEFDSYVGPAERHADQHDAARAARVELRQSV
jgi:hypothetical protein